MNKKFSSRFDRRSLAIFAGLALSAGLATAQFAVGPSAPAKSAQAAPGAKATAAPEAQATKTAFQRADADSNGSISRAEAKQVGGNMDRWFDQMDSNKDGQISTAEFQTTRK